MKIGSIRFGELPICRITKSICKKGHAICSSTGLFAGFPFLLVMFKTPKLESVFLLKVIFSIKIGGIGFAECSICRISITICKMAHAICRFNRLFAKCTSLFANFPFLLVMFKLRHHTGTYLSLQKCYNLEN